VHSVAVDTSEVGCICRLGKLICLPTSVVGLPAKVAIYDATWHQWSDGFYLDQDLYMTGRLCHSAAAGRLSNAAVKLPHQLCH